MDLYINGTGIVCAAGNNINAPLELSFGGALPDRFKAAEPDYKGTIPPMQLRRMSKPVRMGIAASKASLKHLDAASVQAISVGTSLGCLNDTEHFLGKMVTQDEQMLTPTSFIQSTHNTVAGQIALTMGCKGHNMTFVHKGHSFEHAIINAGLYLTAQPDAVLIAGGIDEMTDTSEGLLREASVFKKTPPTVETYFNNGTPGAYPGEGAAFFSISAKKLHPSALKLARLDTFTETNCEKAIFKIRALLKDADFTPQLLVTGESGDQRWDHFYVQLGKTMAGVPADRFKHFSGEYATASAIALGMLTDAALHKNWSCFPSVKKDTVPQRILLVNNYIHYYSCWFLENDAI